MRESIGGAFLFNIVLIFLGIYVSVLAFALVYARAYNSKNHVITLLEKYEGYSKAQGEINNYMATRVGGLNITINDCCATYAANHATQGCGNNVRVIPGGCVFEFREGTTVMYEVTTYMRVDIPIISALVRLWPITGETAVIYENNKAN